jgi:hypothetical protein
MAITVELRGFERFERDLRRMAKQAIPHAARNALNSSAFETQKRWRAEVKQSFTTRNSFTERAILVDKAKGLNTRAMVAVVGSVAPYMADQEYGGTVRGGGSKKAIPGPVAAGQSPGGKRTRLVRAPNKLSAIHVRRPLQRYGKRRRNAVAIAIALSKKDRFVMLERKKGGGRGLFALKGTKRAVRTRLLWDVSKRSVRVRPEPTLQRSMKALDARYPTIWHDALVAQLRRHRVWGY